MTVRVGIHTASLRLVDGAEIEAASTIAAVLQALQPGSVAARHLGDLPFAAITITAEPVGHKPQTLNQERNG